MTVNQYKQNAFRVLGITADASSSQIRKTAKRFEKKMHIGQPVEPEINFDVFENEDIDEKGIQGAQNRLSTPKKRVVDSFFWLQLPNSSRLDHDLLMSSTVLSLIEKLESNSSNNGLSFIDQKNLSILYNLFLIKNGHSRQQLKQSLNIWKRLTEQDEFWATFWGNYKQNDPHATADSVLDEFRDNIHDKLSTLYIELGEKNSKKERYVASFANYFDTIGKKGQEKVLEPIYEAVEEAVTGLEKIGISDDGVFDEQEKAQLKTLTSNLQKELNRLEKNGLANTSRGKTLKDRGVTALRVVYLDLHNNLGETKKALEVSKKAQGLCGTEELKNKIDSDVETLNQELLRINILGGIMDNIENGNRSDVAKAINAINDKLKKAKQEKKETGIDKKINQTTNKNSIDAEKKIEILKDAKRECAIIKAMTYIRQFQETLEGKTRYTIISRYNELDRCLRSHINIFSFDSADLDDIDDKACEEFNKVEYKTEIEKRLDQAMNFAHKKGGSEDEKGLLSQYAAVCFFAAKNKGGVSLNSFTTLIKSLFYFVIKSLFYVVFPFIILMVLGLIMNTFR